jgi:hypothetical protein
MPEINHDDESWRLTVAGLVGINSVHTVSKPGSIHTEERVEGDVEVICGPATGPARPA